jgi:hypothetical protein
MSTVRTGEAFMIAWARAGWRKRVLAGQFFRLFGRWLRLGDEDTG